MSKAIIPFQQDMSLAETIRLGEVLAQSGFFQDSRQAAQAVTKVLAGRELGFGPIASMTNIYIVNGRVTLSAILMGAAIKRSGKYDYRIKSHSNDSCEIEFFENSQSLGISKFDKEDAARAGLLGKDNWKKHPANMYLARALSNGAKWYCPDIFGGPVYTPEELGVEVDADGEIIEGAVLSGPAMSEPEQREPMPRKDAPAHPARKAPAPAQHATTGWKQDGPTGKRPPVKGGGWTSAATQLSEKEPYYQTANGSPDFFHMLGAAGKMGYLEINDANLADVIADLEGYANRAEAEVEQAEQLAAEA